MNRIGLKINGIWCVLPQDVSISIEEQNPLFSDSGSFSYPIELSVSQNRELFKSIDSPQGRTRPQHLDGLPFELWFDGVMLLYGSTETDEDLDIDEDKCSINLVSGNGDFQSKIEGMQCTDVPLLGDVELGYAYTDVEVDIRNFTTGESSSVSTQIDESQLMVFTKPNMSFSYDAEHTYCNVRICVEKNEPYVVGQEEPYWVLDANRPFSGVCFYVAYFLDCLMAHLNVVKGENHISNVEDMMRLAFFTTKCDVSYGEKTKEAIGDPFVSNVIKEIKDDGGAHFAIMVEGNLNTHIVEGQAKIVKTKLNATNKNFPNTSVSDVVSSLFNAFGLKLAFDPIKNEVSIHYMRDILRDNEILDAPLKVRNRKVSYSKVKGVTLTYGGSDDDTAFVYNDWTKVSPFTDYKAVMQGINPYDKTCYVSQTTGNKYRYKNNAKAEEEGKKEELYPTLFEVAQYNDYILGEDTEDNIELPIKFTPLIEQAVSGDADEKLVDINPQRLAVFIPDVKMDKPMTSVSGNTRKIFAYGWDSPSFAYANIAVSLDVRRIINYKESDYKKDPLQEYDAGFTLGVMRGPGSEGGYTTYLENYDGNGNSAWTTVVADYAFTADTMDAYGNRYDYNGTSNDDITEEGDNGVINQANSISLKTHIQTAQDLGLKDKDGNPINWGINGEAAKRGLADRFMSEYMHFLLHRKTVSMEVDTTLSQLTSLSWFKQLRISDTVGRLKSRSYTLTNSGVSDMSIELYTIN